MTSHSEMLHLLSLVRTLAITAEFPVVVHLLDMAILEVEELAVETEIHAEVAETVSKKK